MDKMTWIVVADAGHARVFATQSQYLKTDELIDNFKLVQKLDQHDSHTKVKNVISEKADSANFGTFVDGSDPKEGKAAHFAQNISQYLDRARLDHQYVDLMMIAPPHFMGLLNQHLHKEVQKLITTSIDKDYTAENEKILIERIKTHVK